MTIYRLCNTEHKHDHSGFGAELHGGRWNAKGTKAVYASNHISLIVLETLVNLNINEHTQVPDFHLIELELPDELISELDTKKLKNGWNSDIHYTRHIGEHFLQAKHNLALKIPSVVIPLEWNYLINPKHPLIKQLKVKKSRLYKLDNWLNAY
jgi:RES domain-containing protein